MQLLSNVMFLWDCASIYKGIAVDFGIKKGVI